MHNCGNRWHIGLQGLEFRNRPVGRLHAAVRPLMPAIPQTSSHQPHEKYRTSVDRWHNLKYDP
jgi:hypothetical protein